MSSVLAETPKPLKGNAAMGAKIIASSASHRLTAALGLVLTLVSASAASAYQGTAEQRRACTPDVYRLCAGEIPQCPRHHRLPAAAERQSERCLPGRDGSERILTATAPDLLAQVWMSAQQAIAYALNYRMGRLWICCGEAGGKCALSKLGFARRPDLRLLDRRYAELDEAAGEAAQIVAAANRDAGGVGLE